MGIVKNVGIISFFIFFSHFKLLQIIHISNIKYNWFYFIIDLYTEISNVVLLHR